MERLPEAEVHVWSAWLPTVKESMEVLSQEERNRAGRFHFERDRERYIASHATLRRLLARYTGMEPAGITFRLGPRGKPSLADSASNIEFNMAHSGEMALYAFARGARIGIDVEHVRPGPAEETIAERFFSAAEVTALSSLPDEERREAFFRCWSRKEAYLKAKGEGIGFGLDQFTVSLLPGEPARLVEMPVDESQEWSMYHLEPRDSYIGAVAVEGRVEWLRCYYWDANGLLESNVTGE